MTDTTTSRPVAMRRGRRADRLTLARLRAVFTWLVQDQRRPGTRDAGLLILRVTIGAVFLVHGLDKLLDLDAAEAFFDALGIPWSGAVAPLVALTEAAGGVLLIAGVATPLAGLALAGDMLVAYLTAHLGHGFFAASGGGELVLLLGAGSVALAVTGAGRFSAAAGLRVSRGRTAPDSGGSDAPAEPEWWQTPATAAKRK